MDVVVAGAVSLEAASGKEAGLVEKIANDVLCTEWIALSHLGIDHDRAVEKRRKRRKLGT
jgi:hypothetical protein